MSERIRRSSAKCACGDPGCPHCHGKCDARAVTVMLRIDMEDRFGTPMCRKCADDALESGLFNDKPSKLKYHLL